MNLEEILAGVQYVQDKNGRKTAVLIDMGTWRAIQEILAKAPAEEQPAREDELEETGSVRVASQETYLSRHRPFPYFGQNAL